MKKFLVTIVMVLLTISLSACENAAQPSQTATVENTQPDFLDILAEERDINLMIFMFCGFEDGEIVDASILDLETLTYCMQRTVFRVQGEVELVRQRGNYTIVYLTQYGKRIEVRLDSIENIEKGDYIEVVGHLKVTENNMRLYDASITGRGSSVQNSIW